MTQQHDSRITVWCAQARGYWLGNDAAQALAAAWELARLQGRALVSVGGRDRVEVHGGRYYDCDDECPYELTRGEAHHAVGQATVEDEAASEWRKAVGADEGR